MLDIKNLNGIKSGMYKVDTAANSVYLLDFDDLKGMRVNNSGDTLRRDGEWFKFITVSCEVGKEMRIWTNDIADDDDIFTYRYSTPVLKIEKVDRYE